VASGVAIVGLRFSSAPKGARRHWRGKGFGRLCADLDGGGAAERLPGAHGLMRTSSGLRAVERKDVDIVISLRPPNAAGFPPRSSLAAINGRESMLLRGKKPAARHEWADVVADRGRAQTRGVLVPVGLQSTLNHPALLNIAAVLGVLYATAGRSAS